MTKVYLVVAEGRFNEHGFNPVEAYTEESVAAERAQALTKQSLIFDYHVFDLGLNCTADEYLKHLYPTE